MAVTYRPPVVPEADAVALAAVAAEAVARAAADMSLEDAIAEFETSEPASVGLVLFPLLGQSNMEGQGVADATRFDASDPDILNFPAVGTYANQWIIAVDPLGHPRNVTGMGPGLSFGKWAKRLLAPGERVGLVPCAWGGSGFEVTQFAGRTWKIDSVDPLSLYQLARTQIIAALAAAGPGARIGAFLWHQGEADSTNTNDAYLLYEANLDDLIEALRTEFGAEIPFVLGQTIPENLTESAYKIAVNAVHVDTPRRHLLSGFAYGEAGHDDGAGGSHYLASGLRAMGRDMAAAYARAKLNVLGTAPPPIAGLALVQSGTTLTATWDQGARVTDYDVEYKLTAAPTWAAATRTSPNIDVAQAITGLTLGESYDVRVRSVNEQGDSSWATASLTMATIPAQPTGVTLGTATSVTQPVTWTAVTGATSYLLERSPAGAGTWTTAATVTSPAATATGLSPSTNYDYRVTASNGAGSSAASATVTGSTAGAEPIIDAVGVAAARAYGVRKLRTAYAGSAIRVRRSSDSTEQDIGFTGGGVLDTAALLTFCGAGDGFVAKLYDQSGNARDLTQATAANQPKIVTAGVVNTLNSQPYMHFDGTNDIFWDSSPGMFAAGSASVLSVFKLITTGSSTRILGETRSSTTGSVYYPEATQSSVTNRTYSVWINDAGTLRSQNSDPARVSTDALHQHSFTDDGNLFMKYLDGTWANNVGQAAVPHTTTTLDRFCIGGSVLSGSTASLWSSFQLCETVIWYSKLTDVQRQVGEDNAQALYATP